MKTYLEYLKESADQKKYEFKIKIAGDLPDHCEDCMKAAFEKYKVSKFSKGKTTPIQASLMEFPDIKNSVMTMFDAEFEYPTTGTVLAELIATSTGIPRDAIRVRTPIEEENLEAQELVPDEKKTALLNQDYDKDSHQDLVGDKHVSSFLKTLAKISKETQPTQYKGVNDKLLAKSAPKEKADLMPKAGPAKSLFGSVTKLDPRKGK
jgi:hypothetical protein